MAVTKKKTKRQALSRWIIIILLIVIILLLIRMCSPLPEKNEVLLPDYAPEVSEPHAEQIPGDTCEKPENQGSESVSLTYSNQVIIDLSENSASLYFANPSRSNQDLIIQIVIQDEVIAQSALIPAGYQIETLDLLNDAVKKLREGGYEGTFMVHYYSQNTGGRAMVNTEIPIHIVIKK